MEMIRVSQAAFRPDGGAPSRCSSRTSPATRSAAGSRSRWPATLRSPPTGSYKLGTPEVTLGLLPGNGGTQRLTAADRAVARRWSCWSPAAPFTRRGGARDGPRRRRAARPRRREDKVREYAERLAARPALAIAAIKRCVHEGGQQPLDDGLRARARADRAAVPLARTRPRGCTAFVEKRDAASSWAHEHRDDRRPPSSGRSSTARRGRERGDALPISDPAHGRGGRRRAGAAPRRRRRARSVRRATRCARGRDARRQQARRDPARAAPTHVEEHVDELVAAADARAGQDAARGADRDAPRRSTRSSTTPGLSQGSCAASHVPGLDPGVDGHGAPPPARRRRRRSCRGTSRRRCCATSSARRSWPATRWSPSRPTRRR